MPRAIINVSGVRFEFDVEVLNNKHVGRLARLVNEADVGSDNIEIVVDRQSNCFDSILTYYQTGELHLPYGVCPGYFRKEMEFWEISSDVLADCCSYRYYSFFDELETRQKFQKETLQTEAPPVPHVPVTSGSSFRNMRSRVWKIVDFGENTIIAKIYLGLVLLMVLFSVLSLAYSTEPYFQRSLTKCELIEYLEAIGHKHRETVKKRLGTPDCNGIVHKGDDSNLDEYDLRNDMFYYNGYFDDNQEWSYYYDEIDSNDTDTNVGNDTNKVQGPKIKQHIDIPTIKVPITAFTIIDTALLSFFTIDLICRLGTCPSFKLYFTSIINIFDTCALLGSFVHLVIITVEKEHRYEHSWIRFILYTQIFRALRLFRLVRSVRASKVLAYSIRQNLRDVSLLAILLTLAISVFSCLIYFIEDRSTIASIPEAWYWAMITMTTVGYGDISPKTGFGRLVASICAVCGVLLLAITLPMFVNSFLTLYQYSCVNDIIKHKKQQKIKFKGAVFAVSIANLSSTNNVKHKNKEEKANMEITDINNELINDGQNVKVTGIRDNVKEQCQYVRKEQPISVYVVSK